MEEDHSYRLWCGTDTWEPEIQLQLMDEVQTEVLKSLIALEERFLSQVEIWDRQWLSL